MTTLDRPSCPLYRLVDDGSNEVLLEAEEIEGFFVASMQDGSEPVIFRGMPSKPRLSGKDLDEAKLQIVDFRGEKIGSYYVGRARLGVPMPSAWGASYLDIEASLFGFACHYPQAGAMWRRWASGRPIQVGEWLSYSVDAHPSWLHVVQTAWFEFGHDATRYETSTSASIDGLKMPSRDSFYCAIGEALNGPGGYFGAGLDSLEECIRASRTSTPPLRITWFNSSVSRDVLGDEYVETILQLMRDHKVSVVAT